MPIDLHAVYDGTGAVTLLKQTNIPTHDGLTVAGVPMNPKQKAATLFFWGALALTAKQIAELQLQSQDMPDVLNGENLNIGGASLMLLLGKWTQLPYTQGSRDINILQVAAGKEAGFTMDYYSEADAGGKEPAIPGSRFPDWDGKVKGPVLVSMPAPAASTATTTWNEYPFVQAVGSTWLQPLPNGKYAILGASVSNIANVGLLRFAHADFGSSRPGFPVRNRYDVATSAPLIATDEVTLIEHYQFVRIGEILKKPVCPVFNVNGNATGLNVEY